MSAVCKNTRVLQKIILFRRCQLSYLDVVPVFRSAQNSRWNSRSVLTGVHRIEGIQQGLCNGEPACCTLSAGSAISSGQIEQRRCMSRKQPVVYKKRLSFDYAGDVAKLPALDPKAYVYKYRNLSEVESAPEPVKKLISLEFADGATRKKHRKYDIIKHIDKHLEGHVDKEKIIARWTIEIRNQINHCLLYRRDKVGKVTLIEKIAARKKQLRILRKLDFERFYWLLHELRIRYVPLPLYNKRPTKRYLRKQAVRRRARRLWESKMDEFKKSVAAEKKAFYEEKEKTLAKIQHDLQELNINENEVFSDFKKSLEPPKVEHISKNYKRILRNYEKAVASGKFIPKPTMSPVR